MDTKVCGKCKIEKEISEFHKHLGHKDGCASYCKDCKNAQDKARYKTLEVREKARAASKAYRSTAEAQVLKKAYNQTPEAKALAKAYSSTAEAKAANKVCHQSPEYKLSFRDNYYKRNYGITLEDYERMFEDQKGLCLICGNVQAHKSFKHLCIDHNHETGEVRGLLCHNCNTKLGWYETTKDWYENNTDKIDKYLKK